MSNYAFEGPKWTTQTITWSFASAASGSTNPFSSFIVNPAYQNIIQQAFATWAQYVGLNFVEVGDSRSVDIRLGFADLTGHNQVGDTAYSFTQGVFLPGVDVELEDPSQLPIVNSGGTYTYGSGGATVLQVALHEIGHALGLAHSTDTSAVMYPVLSRADTTLDSSDIAGIQALYGAPPSTSLAAFDATLGQSLPAAAAAYTGPVPGLQEQYVNITTDNLNISAGTPNWFIHTGSGNDAIAANSGTNVLDGGTGSNFLTGGSGTDTFFVDDRGPAADTWSTVVGFHAGDAATIWGVTPEDFGLAWADGQGATGFTGLTLHATASGLPTASLTLAGYTQADLASGRLAVRFGTDAASGSAYMYVQGTA